MRRNAFFYFGKSAHLVTLSLPSFVVITRVEDAQGTGSDYVVSNEATGRYFLANQATVSLLDGLRRTGNLAQALYEAGIGQADGKAILEQLMRYGVVVQRGVTHQAQAPKAPLESKLISLRFDMIDAASFTRKIAWLGQIAYSRAGFFIWLLTVTAMGYLLLVNGEKARFALQQVALAGWQDLLRFAVLFVGLKVVHEMGHALAYRVMCLREGHDPGPIRMGVAIFALTPFPFTDVTGAWRLRSKWRRAAIGAGGIYFEIGATALLTIFWGLTTSGPLQVTIFQVAIFTALTTILFNLNPAVKLDGYYVLSDLTGQHNIATRGSAAARQWLTRRLGGTVQKPERRFLGYWLFSYAYRWTLFAGIFWIFYRIDQRLAVPIATVIFLMLIGRPLLTSLKYATRNGAKPMNMILMGGIAAGVIAACFVPFTDRLLLEGRTLVHDTRFVYAIETAQVNVTQDDANGPAIDLINPELAFQARDLALRRAILDNAARSVTGSASEQARLVGNATSLQTMTTELDQRMARLQIAATDNEAWDLREAERYQGSWVRAQSGKALAVLSQPAPLRVLVWLDQGAVEQGLLGRDVLQVDVRIAADPACQFSAETQGPLSDIAAQSGVFGLTTFPRGEMPECLSQFPQGAAVVARLETAPKSVFERIRRTVTRLLQNRLPGENLTQNL